MSLEPFETRLPQWMRDTLREPVASDPSASDRIMRSVLAEARYQQRRRAPSVTHRRGWHRRGVLSPLVGVIATMAMAISVMLRLDHLQGSSPLDAYAHIVGDSVVPVAFNEANADAYRKANQTVNRDARWLDTLRIVEFVLRGPSIHSASALGEFNRWQRAITPLARVASNEWRARVLVPRDALSTSSHVAMLVNGERIVPSAIR